MRPKTAIVVILAFLTAFFAPVRTSWACPDGTACVAGNDGVWVCPGGACRSEASCCVVSRPTACKHGAFPGSGPPDSSGPRVTATDHCSFAVSGKPQLTSLIEQPSKLVFLLVALPEAAAAIPLLRDFAPVWLTVDTLGYRPPPCLSTGPSRAPPTA